MALSLAAAAPAAIAAPPANQATVLVSGSPAGTSPIAHHAQISDDGSKVLFSGQLKSFVPDATGTDHGHLFVRDLDTNALQTVAIGDDAQPANSDLSSAHLSGNGRYVVFSTGATNLDGGTGGAFSLQVYRWDSQTGTTQRASESTAGGHGNGFSDRASISADGRYVSFVSAATDLIPGGTAGTPDLYLHDFNSGVTSRLVENFGYNLDQVMSGDATTIVFASPTDGLVPEDANGKIDVFALDVATKVITLVSTTPGGGVGGGSDSFPGVSVSDDGNIIAFESTAADLVSGDTSGTRDLFVRTVSTSTTTLGVPDSTGGWPNAGVQESELSSTGRFVTFRSSATDLGPASTGASTTYLRDLETGRTIRVGLNGSPPNGDSGWVYNSASANGRYVAFTSFGTVPGDSVEKDRVFVRNLAPVITAAAAPTDVDFGAQYSFTVTTTGSDESFPSTFAVTAGALPGGLTLNPSTGAITGSPDLEGTFTFSVTATNAVGSTTKAFTVTVKPDPTPNLDVIRLAGVDRYDTGVLISQASFPIDGSADVVYVATGANYPDALAAGPAAAEENAPLLLTATASVPASVLAEIQRLAPDKIIVIGGTPSVSAAAFAQLDALPGEIERIAGPDRYATSRAIVEHAFDSADGAYVATGSNFPDALSAGGVAGANSEPVVLLDGAASTANAATKSLLTTLGADSLRIVGSAASVSAGIATSLNSIGTVSRIEGPSRYATSQAINQRFTSSDIVILATGVGFPDALAGGAWAGNAGAPLYIVPGTCVPSGVIDEIDRLGATTVYLLGGTGTLSPAVATLTPCP